MEIYFETYGCTANYNSTEIMKGLVKQAGLNITENYDYADLIIINSCIVKEPTEEKIRRKVFDLLKKNKKVILAGCMPRLNLKYLEEKKNLYLLDTHHIKQINELIQDISNEDYNPEKYLSKRNEIKSDLPKISKEKLIGINQISEGCLGECSYCIVKIAKGKLFSYPEEKIIESVKKDLQAGCKEIWITSQDNAAYGNEEKKFELPNLLKKILSLPGNFYLRIGMMNPNNVLKILPELIEIYRHPKMFKFLHLPIQSGSDRILNSMNRKYKKKDILKIINEFKKEIPEITISTDIIVGYPGETEEDFQETLDLIEEIKPEMLNRSNFYPRPNTLAEKMKQISPEKMKERATKLMELHLEICKQNQKKYESWEGKVLVDQKGFGKTYLARSNNYKLFGIHSDKKIIGKLMNVKVKKTSPHYLFAEENET